MCEWWYVVVHGLKIDTQKYEGIVKMCQLKNKQNENRRESKKSEKEMAKPKWKTLCRKEKEVIVTVFQICSFNVQHCV